MDEGSSTWVFNASPLIVLARTGHIGLLSELQIEYCVPDAVAAEVTAGPVDAARHLVESGWGRRLPPIGIPDGVMGWALGNGESAVIGHCVANRGWLAVLDDAQARSCARSFGVPVIGSVGILVRAKRTGLLPSLKEAHGAFVRAGLYIDQGTIHTALSLAGEL